MSHSGYFCPRRLWSAYIQCVIGSGGIDWDNLPTWPQMTWHNPTHALAKSGRSTNTVPVLAFFRSWEAKHEGQLHDTKRGHFSNRPPCKVLLQRGAPVQHYYCNSINQKAQQTTSIQIVLFITEMCSFGFIEYNFGNNCGNVNHVAQRSTHNQHRADTASFFYGFQEAKRMLLLLFCSSTLTLLQW